MSIEGKPWVKVPTFRLFDGMMSLVCFVQTLQEANGREMDRPQRTEWRRSLSLLANEVPLAPVGPTGNLGQILAVIEETWGLVYALLFRKPEPALEPV